MPRVTVWVKVKDYKNWCDIVDREDTPEMLHFAIDFYKSIKKEDRQKWDAIGNKAEWLHKVIQLGYKEYELSMHPVLVLDSKSGKVRKEDN